MTAHIFSSLGNNDTEGGEDMGNPKRSQQNFTPDHLGEKSVVIDANKGKKMADKTGREPQVIQTKGE